MKTSNVIAAALFSLAGGVICAGLVLGHTITNARATMPAPYDMSNAPIIVTNVDMFDHTDKGLMLAGHVVECDLDEQTEAELFHVKEEIVVRVDGNRMGIIAGDNGEF